MTNDEEDRPRDIYEAEDQIERLNARIVELLRERDELTAALAEHVVGWQPIETAPKDGTDILITSPKRGARVARYQHWCGLEWFVALEPGSSGGTYADDATHWMPLPAAPVPRHQCAPVDNKEGSQS
jgi:Protein of unknown function (DUF551)